MSNAASAWIAGVVDIDTYSEGVYFGVPCKVMKVMKVARTTGQRGRRCMCDER